MLPLMTAAGIYFNPRSREGSDRIRELADRYAGISIHAPVKGATRICSGVMPRAAYFNPRSREGSDMIWRVLRAAAA